MSDHNAVGIRPAHEIFYLESMLIVTSAALDASDRVVDALAEGANHEPESNEWQECTYDIMHGVHTLAVQAGALHRYFWPVRNNARHRARAEMLRHSLGVDDNDLLQAKGLRDCLEHFDERLDKYLSNAGDQVVKLAYVGSLANYEAQGCVTFRAFFTDVGVFEVLGLRLEMQPVLDEVRRVHNLIVECLQDGGRSPEP